MKYLLIVIFFISCGTKDQEITLVIDEANFYLSSLKCADAKKVLDSIDYQDDNADYVSLYSAYYACLAGYTVLGTVYSNLTSIDATGAGLLRSLAAFNSSNETVADSEVYTNLKLAISEILNNEDSTTDRLTKFGVTKGTDLSIQLLYMVLTELGKYLGLYGNKAVDGTKGGGAGSNGCLMNYDNPAVTPILGVNGSDSCSAIGDGSADLDPASGNFVTRACEGIVLFNVFGDVISNIDFSTNPDLGDLSSTGAIYTTAVTTAVGAYPALANYIDFKTFAECETFSVADTDELQEAFAVYIESLYE